MKRFWRVLLGFMLIFLGLLGFIFPTLQAFLLLVVGTLVLWSDIQSVLNLLNSFEKHFPRSKDHVQQLKNFLDRG
jgi:uncharacterized membrane protein HdeD (DUF308 family)